MQSHVTHEITRIGVHLNVGTFIISSNGTLCTMTSEVLAPTTDLRRVNYGHEMLKEGLHDL